MYAAKGATLLWRDVPRVLYAVGCAVVCCSVAHTVEFPKAPVCTSKVMVACCTIHADSCACCCGCPPVLFGWLSGAGVPNSLLSDLMPVGHAMPCHPGIDLMAWATLSGVGACLCLLRCWWCTAPRGVSYPIVGWVLVFAVWTCPTRWSVSFNPCSRHGQCEPRTFDQCCQGRKHSNFVRVDNPCLTVRVWLWMLKSLRQQSLH